MSPAGALNIDDRTLEGANSQHCHNMRGDGGDHSAEDIHQSTSSETDENRHIVRRRKKRLHHSRRMERVTMGHVGCMDKRLVAWIRGRLHGYKVNCSNPQLFQFVALLSKTLCPHCFSRLS